MRTRKHAVIVPADEFYVFAGLLHFNPNASAILSVTKNLRTPWLAGTIIFTSIYITRKREIISASKRH